MEVRRVQGAAPQVTHLYGNTGVAKLVDPQLGGLHGKAGGGWAADGWRTAAKGQMMVQDRDDSSLWGSTGRAIATRDVSAHGHTGIQSPSQPQQRLTTPTWSTTMLFSTSKAVKPVVPSRIRSGNRSAQARGLRTQNRTWPSS